MDHHAGNVAHDVAHAHHHLVLDEFVGHDGHRLRHVTERGWRLGRTLRRRNDVAGWRRYGHGLAYAFELQHELPRGRRRHRRRHNELLGQVAEPAGGDGDDVAAGRQRQRERAGHVGDGGDRTWPALGNGRHLCAWNGGTRAVHSDAVYGDRCRRWRLDGHRGGGENGQGGATGNDQGGQKHERAHQELQFLAPVGFAL